jgi:hypothetical protein
MSSITTSLTSYLFGLLTSDTGLSRYLSGQADDDRSADPGALGCSVYIENASPDLVERGLTVRYPAVYIFCEKLSNTLKEKFTTFSGTADLVVEVRCSQDRLDGIRTTLDRYVEAACTVLDAARGPWQDGAYYTGEYTVAFPPVKHGGRNYLQVARISFPVQVAK